MSKLKIVTDKPKTEFTNEELLNKVETGPFDGAEAVMHIVQRSTLPDADKVIVSQYLTMVLMQLLVERGHSPEKLMNEFKAAMQKGELN